MVISYFPYRFGGSLAWNDPSYIKRQTDQELLAAIAQQSFAYVLGPRQIGKSSLRIQTRHRLTQQGYRCASVQATQLQSNHCAGLLSMLYAELISDNLAPLTNWLKSTADLPTVERLTRFTDDFLINLLSAAPAVIFIDEIDALLDIPLMVHLFEWIAQCYDARQENDAYKKLNFVVLGSVIAADLPQSSGLFLSGHSISLSPFNLVETYGFQQGFEEKLEDPTPLLTAIFKWTHGQPFLTQKLCFIANNLIDSLVQPSYKPIVLSAKTIHQWVDELVRSHILENWQTKDEPIHLRAIGDRINRSYNKKALLSLYKELLMEHPVNVNNSYTQAELLLSGLIIAEAGQLKVANQIYRYVFALR